MHPLKSFGLGLFKHVLGVQPLVDNQLSPSRLPLEVLFPEAVASIHLPPLTLKVGGIDFELSYPLWHLTGKKHCLGFLLPPFFSELETFFWALNSTILESPKRVFLNVIELCYYLWKLQTFWVMVDISTQWSEATNLSDLDYGHLPAQTPASCRK